MNVSLLSNIDRSIESWRKLSKRQLEELVLYKNAEIGKLDGDEKLPPDVSLNDDWGLSAVGQGGKTIVLRAISKSARRIAFLGRINFFKQLGYTDDEAAALVSLRVQFKNELAGLVLKVFEQEYLLKAYLAHPLVFGPDAGSARTNWKKSWYDTLPDEFRALNAPRESALATMVQTVNNLSK